MSKKQLVWAVDVQAAAKAGVKVIHLHSPNALVTDEARSLAKELGVALTLTNPCRLTNRLIKLDLPTLERPAKAISG